MVIFTVFELLGGHKSSVMRGGKCYFQELEQKRKTWFGQAFEVLNYRRGFSESCFKINLFSLIHVSKAADLCIMKGI